MMTGLFSLRRQLLWPCTSPCVTMFLAPYTSPCVTMFLGPYTSLCVTMFLWPYTSPCLTMFLWPCTSSCVTMFLGPYTSPCVTMFNTEQRVCISGVRTVAHPDNCPPDSSSPRHLLTKQMKKWTLAHQCIFNKKKVNLY